MFLSMASALTNEELELALARIEDRLNAASEERERMGWRFRGRLLKSYFDLRLGKRKRINIFRRFEGYFINPHFIKRAVEAHIFLPADENELSLWTDQSFASDVGLL